MPLVSIRFKKKESRDDFMQAAGFVASAKTPSGDNVRFEKGSSYFTAPVNDKLFLSGEWKMEDL